MATGSTQNLVVATPSADSSNAPSTTTPLQTRGDVTNETHAHYDVIGRECRLTWRNWTNGTITSMQRWRKMPTAGLHDTPSAFGVLSMPSKSVEFIGTVLTAAPRHIPSRRQCSCVFSSGALPKTPASYLHGVSRSPSRRILTLGWHNNAAQQDSTS